MMILLNNTAIIMTVDDEINPIDLKNSIIQADIKVKSSRR